MNNFPEIKHQIAVHWFRRDLRLNDNHALFLALKSGLPVLPVFIFDTDILQHFQNKQDKRVSFIYDALYNIQNQLNKIGSGLLIFHGKPSEIWTLLSEKYNVAQVFANTDYEPYARKRDDQVNRILQEKGIIFTQVKDQVIFEKSEICKADNTPYTVFTPYSNKWKANLQEIEKFPSENLIHQFCKFSVQTNFNLDEIGYTYTGYQIPEPENTDFLIQNYDQIRDFPSVRGTSRQSVNLRFGTVSVRSLVKKALPLNEKYLNELIWREFYMQILWNFPHVENSAFKKQYDLIEWQNNESDFERWCTGTTGFPIVDAGMRELLATGFMHNRVRMIVASFLTKNLLIDWRWGEAFFAQHLLDFELASNNGGWQWAAGSGVDAAPYFRIFSPIEQTRKYDPKGEYIRKWIPELDSFSYPKPMVALDFSRKRALETYQKAVKLNV